MVVWLMLIDSGGRYWQWGDNRRCAADVYPGKFDVVLVDGGEGNGDEEPGEERDWRRDMGETTTTAACRMESKSLVLLRMHFQEHL